jgi:DNA-binding NtrC family response regulator
MLRRFMDYRAVGYPQILPRGKVLLVDDDLRDLEYHVRLLESCGQEVLSCAAYAQGASLVECGTFDLVMVGQGSPAFEGRVVLERAASTDRSMPVLVVASSVDMRCYLEAMRLGVIDYLEKPVSPTEMRRVIETCLRARMPA